MERRNTFSSSAEWRGFGSALCVPVSKDFLLTEVASPISLRAKLAADESQGSYFTYAGQKHMEIPPTFTITTPIVPLPQPPPDAHRHNPITFRSSRIVYYGPHACSNCGRTVCKMGHEWGGTMFSYPQGPIYPNTEWHPHVCDPRDVSAVPRAIGEEREIAPYC